MSETSGELVIMRQPLQAVAVFAPGGVDDILTKLKNEVRSIPTDISTPQGRAAVKSLAYKVARSKTALDEMGKNLVEEWKAKANAVDADRRRIRNELDALKDEVRADLTAWEMAEQARIDGHENAIKEIAALPVFETPEPAIDLIAGRLETAKSHSRDWQEFAGRAAQAKGLAVASLEKLLATRTAQEAERAELARLKAEAEERARKEREETIAREAAERAKREAEETAAREARAVAEREAAKITTAKAEQERAEQAARDAEAKAIAAENARIAAAAAAEQARIDAAAKAERDKQAAIEAERKRQEQVAEAERIAAEKREANTLHVAAVNREIVAALVAHAEIGEDVAKAVVIAIAKLKIPHLKISY